MGKRTHGSLDGADCRSVQINSEVGGGFVIGAGDVIPGVGAYITGTDVDFESVGISQSATKIVVLEVDVEVIEGFFKDVASSGFVSVPINPDGAGDAIC